MTIGEKIKDEKLQCDINREAAKISALLSGKIDKYEYLIAEEIFPSQSLHTPLSVKHLKNKQKRLTNKRKSK